MNTKEMIAALVTAMVVATMFASSAAAITVDGDGSEWDPAWMIDPSPDAHLDPYADAPGTSGDVTIYGYDLMDVWQHYDSVNDTMYWRYDVWWDVPGDLDGNGNPDTDAPSDDFRVGPKEQYTIIINSATVNELQLEFSDNDVTAWRPSGTLPSPDEMDAEEGRTPTPVADRCIEFSLENASKYMDPCIYTICGLAGGSKDIPGEDWLETEFDIGPCEFDFTFEQSCCKRMQFTGTSTGDMVNHTWDFGGSGTADAPLTRDGRPEDYPPINYVYNDCGTYEVTLSGWCDSGCLRYNETSPKDVYVNCGPDAKATASPKKVDVDTPTSVKFDGSASTAAWTPAWAPPAPAIASYHWSFTDGTYDSGHIMYKTVTLGPGETLSATLTVNDTHCEGAVTVSVTTTPPQEVPLLALPGLLALIGMMCIVGAGRILTKGRRP